MVGWREWLTPPVLKRGVHLLLLGAAFALSTQLSFTLCPFANVTGHPCPGCGMTRAGLLLLQLDIGTALRQHPLSFVCVPMLAVLSLQGGASYALGKRVAFKPLTMLERQATWWMLALGAALFGVWIARFFGALGGPVSVAPSVLNTLPQLLRW
jgi:hypothetical protein